jgi:hypothetical protein
VNRARELDPEFCDVEHQEAVLKVRNPHLLALQCARLEGTSHFDSAVIDSAGVGRGRKGQLKYMNAAALSCLLL